MGTPVTFDRVMRPPFAAARHRPRLEERRHGHTMNHPGLALLPGRALSSVELVGGGVQLRFDGPCLWVSSLPSIERQDGAPAAPAARHQAARLIELIGEEVSSVADDDQVIHLQFQCGSAISFSLRPRGGSAAEAATLDVDGQTFWWW